MRRSAVLRFLGFAAFAISGCDARPASEGYEVFDSAGVQVVVNRAPLWGPSETWLVPSEPSLSIGQVAGDPDYLFGRVWTSGWLADGRIIVGDETAHSVRVYSLQGEHIRDVGRAGEGPGELGWIWTVEAYRGDSLYVFDYSRRQVSIFDPDLEFARRFTSPVQRNNYWVREAFPDGRFLLFSPGRGRFERGPGLVPDTSLIIAVAPDGSAGDTIGSFRNTVQMLGPDGRPESMHLRPHASLDQRAGVLVWTQGSELEFQVADSVAQVLRVVRIPSEPVPVTDGVIAEFKEAYLAYLSTESLEVPLGRMEASLQTAHYASELPATSDIKLDSEGNTWLAHYAFTGTPPNRWEVFDPRGVWLGTVETPKGLQVQEIRSDALLGLATDELGVVYVRVHQIEKG